ncbi:MAG: FAD-dependent oxidoreductase [Bdellovibrionia bacterium]
MRNGRTSAFTFVVLAALFAGAQAQAAGQCLKLLQQKTLRARVAKRLQTLEVRATEFLLKGENLLSTKDKVPMVIEGLDWKPLFVDESKPIIHSTDQLDTIVVGGGQAGLTTAYALKGSRVLVLEKGNEPGGLATGIKRAGMETDDGTAYQSPPLLEFQEKFYKDLGIHWEKDKITSPSDTLNIVAGVRTLDGKVVYIAKDFWENEKVLYSLPAPFAMIKLRMEMDENSGRIPDQPIHKYSDLSLDYIRWDQYIKGTPKWFRQYIKEKPEDVIAVDLVNRLDKEIEAGIVDKDDPTWLLFQHMTSYANSAGGGNPNQLHSITGANFEIAETRERYTWPLGTGQVSKVIVEKLMARRKGKVTISTESTVLSVKEFEDHVEVLYVKEGQRFMVRAKTAVVSTPLDTTVKLIEDFEKVAPDQYQVIQELREEGRFSDYAVVTMYVKLEGRELNLENPEHPAFVKLTYDLWPIYDGPRNGRPTDFISGHWQATKGYTIRPSADLKYAVVTAYVPQGQHRERTQADLTEVTELAIQTMKELSAPIQKEAGEPPIEVVFAATRYWPSSILVPGPGHSTYREPILDKPTGKHNRIKIAQSGKGTPSNEEAQSQGFRAGEWAAERNAIDRTNIEADRIRRGATRAKVRENRGGR